MDDLKLKVCGMRDHENIMRVAALRPEFMGFIFYQHSPRYVGGEFELPSDFPGDIKRVGVFVNERTEVILETAGRFKLDFIQLHGSEPVKQCHELRQHNYKIIKVFSIDNSFDFASTKFYLAAVDFFLFDTKGKYHGGNSQVFDWSILNKYDLAIPYFLSGGLSTENISSAIKINDPRLYALDINSGVEDSPAIKNPNKIQAVKDIITKA
jgi:phosphoribosylanthranilate isomerase